ncbi:MAG: hypothetical protein KBT03_10075 [Bacteroidales bacterium]|nr:hypothetical protein [Candidatus Scybalousia scybalohippi]
MDLNPDGSFAVVSGNINQQGTWRREGNTIIDETDMGVEYLSIKKLTKNTLVVTGMLNGQSIKMTYKK